MQFADNSGMSVKYILITLLIKKQYASNDRSYLAYKYTTLATKQRDVVVVRTAFFSILSNSLNPESLCVLTALCTDSSGGQ